MPIDHNDSDGTSEAARPRDDGENHPATPFLVVPEDDFDDGMRPRAGTHWISSSSILLLNDQGKLETAPRVTASYRLLILIQNLGAAPVQNGFAEFFLAPKPPLLQTNPAPVFVYQKTPLVQDQNWANLGVSAFSLPFWFLMPNIMQSLALLGAGAFNILSQTCTTQSYRYAPASSVVIFDYTTIIFAFVLGYFFLGELPAYQVYIGGAIIAAASIFIVLRERQLNKTIAAAAVITTDRV